MIRIYLLFDRLFSGLSYFNMPYFAEIYAYSNNPDFLKLSEKYLLELLTDFEYPNNELPGKYLICMNENYF